jgi:hypothetical protein
VSAGISAITKDGFPESRGREDSNLRMVESKSADSDLFFKIRSELSGFVRPLTALENFPGSERKHPREGFFLESQKEFARRNGRPPTPLVRSPLRGADADHRHSHVFRRQGASPPLSLCRRRTNSAPDAETLRLSPQFFFPLAGRRRSPRSGEPRDFRCDPMRLTSGLNT